MAGGPCFAVGSHTARAPPAKRTHGYYGRLLALHICWLQTNMKQATNSFMRVTGVQFVVHVFRSIIMPEREVCSPVSRPGSKVGSGQPLSPGARSNPSLGRTSSSIKCNYGYWTLSHASVRQHLPRQLTSE